MIVDVKTGETLPATEASDEQIAHWRREVMDFEAKCRTAKTAVDTVVIDRMDKQMKWTVKVPGFVLSAPSPAPSIEYENPEGLRDDLDELGLDPVAVAQVVEAVITYRVRADGVKRLRALNRADVDEVLDSHAVEVEKPRRVTVKPV
jgi:hypothetical protein